MWDRLKKILGCAALLTFAFFSLMSCSQITRFVDENLLKWDNDQPAEPARKVPLPPTVDDFEPPP